MSIYNDPARPNRMAANCFSQLVVRGSEILMMVGLNVVVGRILGAAALGRFAFVITTAMMLGVAVDLGVTPFLVSKIRGGQVNPGRYFAGVVKLVSLAGGGSVVGVAVWAASAGTHGGRWVFVLGVGWVALGALRSAYRGVVYAQERMGYEAAAVGFEAAVTLALGIPAVLWGGSLTTVLLAMIAGRAMGLVVCLSLLTRFIGRVEETWTRLSLCALFVELIPFALNSIASLVYLRVDIVLLGIFASKSELGLYQAATTFVNPWGTLIVALNLSVLPALATAAQGGRAEKAVLMFRRNAIALLAAGIAVGLGLAVFREGLTRLVYGSDFVGTAGYVAILAAVLPLRFVNNGLANLLTAAGAQRRRTAAIWMGAAVNLGLNLVAVPRWGALAACLTTVVTELLILLALGRGITRTEGISSALALPRAR